MTRMQHQIDISRSPHAVLAYACAATRWPEWHPSSLKVVGPDGEMPAGIHFEEDILAGGRAGHLSWYVIEYRPAQRWQAKARGNHRLDLLLTYDCRSTANGTLFTRTLDYHLPGLLMGLANRFVLRSRIERESAESLQILKRVAEKVIEESR